MNYFQKLYLKTIANKMVKIITKNKRFKNLCRNKKWQRSKKNFVSELEIFKCNTFGNYITSHFFFLCTILGEKRRRVRLGYIDQWLSTLELWLTTLDKYERFGGPPSTRIFYKAWKYPFCGMLTNVGHLQSFFHRN